MLNCVNTALQLKLKQPDEIPLKVEMQVKSRISSFYAQMDMTIEKKPKKLVQKNWRKDWSLLGICRNDIHIDVTPYEELILTTTIQCLIMLNLQLKNIYSLKNLL